MYTHGNTHTHACARTLSPSRRLLALGRRLWPQFAFCSDASEYAPAIAFLCVQAVIALALPGPEELTLHVHPQGAQVRPINCTATSHLSSDPTSQVSPHIKFHHHTFAPQATRPHKLHHTSAPLATSRPKPLSPHNLSPPKVEPLTVLAVLRVEVIRPLVLAAADPSVVAPSASSGSSGVVCQSPESGFRMTRVWWVCRPQDWLALAVRSGGWRWRCEGGAVLCQQARLRIHLMETSCGYITPNRNLLQARLRIHLIETWCGF